MSSACAGPRGGDGGKALIILPTYNERENLPRLIPALLEQDRSLEILVIDDASPDGTGEIADSFSRETGRVRVLHREGKLGLGTAYKAGFEYALEQGYDYVLQMDADFSHRPEDLPRLLRAAGDTGLVIGSRSVAGGRVENWSVLRRLISRGGSLYARAILGLPVGDCTSGFKCFRREVLETIDFRVVSSGGYGFQVEINYLCYLAGFGIREVPIVFPDRTLGDSKMSWGIFSEAALLVPKLRARRLSRSPAAGPPAPDVSRGHSRQEPSQGALDGS